MVVVWKPEVGAQPSPDPVDAPVTHTGGRYAAVLEEDALAEQPASVLDNLPDDLVPPSVRLDPRQWLLDPQVL